MTDPQWEGLFRFVQQGGGFFALHTASACWDNIVEHPEDVWSKKFHHEMLNCEFGGHSPYKDYARCSLSLSRARSLSPISSSFRIYITRCMLHAYRVCSFLP
jgi:hypothetical protein